ncbi:MAG TPA: hypothetical protein VNU28_00960 [Solirubrobacteraceae bacterium]|jgi:hypothetical protein|nr:hypothetical protein [Solirubrobacteraceae bacterium]
MTAAPTPAGFAPVFAGWNVWSVWQKNDLDIEIGSIGLDADRRLRVWVEDTADAASGAQLHDPLNPSVFHFDGDEVEIIPSDAGLSVALGRETVPNATDLALDGPATLRFVRFYNRGAATILAWPHSSNYLLESVYMPSATNAATNAPAPESTGGDVKQAATAVAAGAGSVLTVVLAVGGLAAGAYLLSQFAKRRA